MSYDTPTVAQFKGLYTRDFPYGAGVQNVQDNDIQIGLDEALININPNLFDSQDAYTLGFLWLSAHYMVLNMRASGAQNQGLNGQWSWLQAGKGVGPISESFGIPERVLANPEFSALCKTTYGAKYLTYVLPKLSGQCFSVRGRTHA